MEAPTLRNKKLYAICRVAVTLAAILLLDACDTKMSYEKASTREPYSHLSEKDRRWLYDYHMTNRGAVQWMGDEIRLRDDHIQIWLTSDHKYELEDPSLPEEYAVSVDKVVKMVQSKGGSETAQTLLAKARKKIGGQSNPPEHPYILIGLTAKARYAQKLCYPKLWKECILGLTQDMVQGASKIKGQGRLSEALQLMAKAIDLRASELGPNHPATQGALALFKGWAGYDYRLKPTATEEPGAALSEEAGHPSNAQPGLAPPNTVSSSSGTDAPPPPATGPASVNTQSLLARADSLIARARDAWQVGDTKTTIRDASMALELRRKALGPDHPKVKEVEQMLKKARAGQGGSPSPAPDN